MKRLLLMLLALLMLCGAACAETEYKVLPAEINMDVMLAEAFGDRVGEAKLEKRENGGLFYDLTDDGAPFCGVQHDTITQTDLSIYTQAFIDAAHEPDLDDNVVPSGVAACKLTREEALARSEDLAARLGLGEQSLQCVSAYGRLRYTVPEYKVCFLQRWNGKPLYWAASAQGGNLPIQTNRATFVWADSGLVRMNGNWSRFEPTGDDRTLIGEQAAKDALTAIGEAPDIVEGCYLMRGSAKQATATPAYRYQNRFVDAFTGEVLQ